MTGLDKSTNWGKKAVKNKTALGLEMATNKP
jgi:hypothetical protein